MRIAVNAIRVSRQGGGGIDHYIIHLVNQLAKQGLDFDLYTIAPEHFTAVNPDKIFRPFFFKKPFPKEKRMKGMHVSQGQTIGFSRFSFAQVCGDLARMIWAQVFFPFYLLFGKKYDLLFSPSQLDALPFLPRALKQVVTVLDIIPFIFKQQRHKHPFYLKIIFPVALKNAAQLIAISENTKKDLVKFFRISKKKITVIPLANPEFGNGTALPTFSEIQRVKEKQGLKKYIFCLSGNHPHKNLPNLIEAFAFIKNQTDCSLLIAGYQDRALQAKLDALVEERQLADKIKFLGHVDSNDLPALYSGAELFVFPSLYEGFGLPPLEALSYGVPVAVSRSSSLPEVVGEAGIYFDPNDPKELAEKITQLLSDENLRNRLKKLGPERAKNFSWAKTAEATINVFKSAFSL